MAFARGRWYRAFSRPVSPRLLVTSKITTRNKYVKDWMTSTHDRVQQNKNTMFRCTRLQSFWFWQCSVISVSHFVHLLGFSAVKIYLFGDNWALNKSYERTISTTVRQTSRQFHRTANFTTCFWRGQTNTSTFTLSHSRLLQGAPPPPFCFSFN